MGEQVDRRRAVVETSTSVVAAGPVNRLQRRIRAAQERVRRRIMTTWERGRRARAARDNLRTAELESLYAPGNSAELERRWDERVRWSDELVAREIDEISDRHWLERALAETAGSLVGPSRLVLRLRCARLRRGRSVRSVARKTVTDSGGGDDGPAPPTKSSQPLPAGGG